MTFHRMFSGLAVAAFCLGLTVMGCGGPSGGTVTGRVTLDGEPYSDASVIFLSMKTGGGSSADVGSDGRFELPDKLPAGTYQVYLAPPIPTENLERPVPVTMDRRIPDKYLSEATTDISVEVVDGPNDVAIGLESR